MLVVLVMLVASIGGFGDRVRKDTFAGGPLGRIVPVRYSRPAPGAPLDVDFDGDVEEARWVEGAATGRRPFTLGGFAPLRF